LSWNQTNIIFLSLVVGMSVKEENYCSCRKLSMGLKDSLANYIEMAFKVNVKEYEISDM